MQGHLRCQGLVAPHERKGFVVRILCALLPFLILSIPSQADMVGDIHDFVDNGFTGGGLCAACHIPHAAEDVRLYPRDAASDPDSGGYPAPKRLCLDCHYDDDSDGWGDLPADGGWAGVVGVSPPAYSHGASATFENCTDCHKHENSFAGGGKTDCLCCHTADGASSKNIDALFDGIGSQTGNGLRSQHNVLYGALVSTDCKTNTVDTAAENECKKCHGNEHPNEQVFLVDADGNTYPDARSLGAPSTNDYSTYEPFCLSCHDGEVGAGGAAAHQFNGSIPSGHVGPSDPGDPAQLQPSPPWEVPAAPSGSAVPYFAHYSDNGHGAASSLISGSPMNRTCLAGGSSEGCHVAHGSKNRFLIDDLNLFGTAIDSVTEFATEVCFQCHLPDLSFPSAYHADPAETVSTFHAWIGTVDRGGPVDTIMHDDSRGASPLRDGMCQMAVFTGNMNISNWTTAAGVLPFYAGNDESNKIHQRSYPGVLDADDWVHCLTCHDPHGTGPDTEPGMLRRLPDTWDYGDALCGQCHVE